MLTDTRIASIKPPATGQEEHPDHKVTGLRLRVGAGGTKTWTLRKRAGSKTVNRKLGSYPSMKLAAARSAAETIIASIELEGTTDGIDRTFADVATHWLENKAKEKNKRWQHQEAQLNKHVLPAFGARKIVEIKRREIRDFIDGIEGKVLPNRILALVKTIFRYALSRDWIEASPVEGIEKPKSEKPRDRVLDMGEVARVWHSAGLLGFPEGHWTRILMLTAQRGGEVTQMKWADLNLDAGSWLIADNKADRANLVPLTDAVVTILREMPQLGEYVFTTTGDKPINGFAKTKLTLDKFIAGKGDPLKPWRFHDLRRTAATHMVRLGISETVVGRVLNHAAKGVTAQVYALHSYAPEKRNALEVWAAEIDRAVNGEGGGNVMKMERS
ncbi:Integrase [Altererythrobacter xiamenensis]|uniref:Integrase n=1 Tax=Altererythrobacter xiamenensis TaxID=1316679 RepID=A0A1Y6FH63_9SPHN|nr:site-specific integrase [Altererythrobacter xiamenensis]SMQ74274.1 Integrase [Altererythrobacter xiamenensis]